MFDRTVSSNQVFFFYLNCGYIRDMGGGIRFAQATVSGAIGI